MAMFEMVPFFWGVCWYIVRRGHTSSLLAGALAIGVVTAAMAGELSLGPSGAVLAVLADGSGAAAGWMLARAATVYAPRH
jgi:hypothetical protein